MSNKQICIKYIKEMFPDAYCELLHNNDLELLIATLLSAQTTDKMVNSVTPTLFEKYKSVYDFDKVSLDELTKDIKKIGLANSKAKNIKLLARRVIEVYGGEIPNKKKELISLAGVGTKTANVFLSVRYNMPLMAVDTHVERVSKRLYFAFEKDSVQKVEEKIYKLISKEDIPRFHHQMIFFGRYHCLARNPKCDICNISEYCRYYKKEQKNVKRD